MPILFSVTSLGYSHNKYGIKDAYTPRVELTGKLGYSSKKANKRHIARLGFVIPIFQKTEKYLLFISAIGLKDTAKHVEGNFGLGYRFFINPNWVIGIYGFYDLRKTANNNLLYQTTFGLEGLSKNLEVRANIYLPVSENYSLDPRKIYNINYTNNTTTFKISKQNLAEIAMHGFDIETGGTLPNIPKLSSFIAFYHFSAKKVKTLNGIRLRANIHVTNWFLIETENSIDNNNKHTGYVGAKLSWNFAKSKNSTPHNSIKNKITQLPVRDIDIVSIVREEYPILLSSKNTDGFAAAIIQQGVLSKRDIINANVPVVIKDLTKLNNANKLINNIGIISSNNILFVNSQNPKDQASK